jgi:hypothetical protein
MGRVRGERWERQAWSKHECGKPVVVLVAYLDRRLLKPACFASIIHPPGRTESCSRYGKLSNCMLDLGKNT